MKKGFINFVIAAALFMPIEGHAQTEFLKEKLNRVESFFSDKFQKKNSDKSDVVAQTKEKKSTTKTKNKKRTKKSNAKKRSKKHPKKPKEVVAPVIVETTPENLPMLEVFVEPTVAEKVTTQPENSWKTAGHYWGVDLTGTRVNFYQRFSDEDNPTQNVKPTYSSISKNIGLGFSYKYAVNFDKFFVAPGVFFDFLNSSASGYDNMLGGYNDRGSQMKVRVKNRYGIKADFGYDINNIISPYFTVGGALVRYNTNNPLVYYDNSYRDNVRRGRATAWIYGVGLKVNMNENDALNFEYNTQSFLAKTTSVDVTGVTDPYGLKVQYKTNLQTLKIGLIHRF